MGAARPIAATDIPGNDELIQHNETGLLVPPKNPEALAAALEHLLMDRELAARLGRAGRDWVAKHLDSDIIVHELEAHLAGLLNEARAGKSG